MTMTTIKNQIQKNRPITLALIALASWMVVIALAIGNSAIAKNTSSHQAIEGRYIVELNAPPTMGYTGIDSMARLSDQALVEKSYSLAPTAPSVTGERLQVQDADVQAYVAFLDRERNEVLSTMSRAMGRSATPYAVYHHVMNGFAIEMSAEEAKLVQQLPTVQSVRPDFIHKRHTDRGPALIGATTLWGFYPEAQFPPSRGSGVVIGIIDSGINWDHQMFQDGPPDTMATFTNPYGQTLGECSRPEVNCNNKLVGVYDFTTEGTFGKDPDEDGHGTHVASTAAGNVVSNFTLTTTGDHSFTMQGVAPNANIISYKVCYAVHPTDEDLNDSCVGSAIGQALDQAIANQVDVVNYSIGGPAGNPWQSAAAFLPMWENDIAFVTSAGNSGPGPETIGNPANAPWVMSVGNSTHDRLVAGSARVGSIDDIAVVPGQGPTVDSDLSATAQRVDKASADNLLACDPLPTDSLSGQIAVIQRGICTFETKINHATQAGAIAVLMVNNVGGLPIVMGGTASTTIPALMMDQKDGQQVLALLDQANQAATIRSGSEVSIDFSWADTMNSSSSRGPTPDVPGLMKPNVVAPGTDILAAYVPDENSIGFLTGTSMASPHVAGAAALLRSIHPDWGVDAVFSALQTTANFKRVTANGLPSTIHDRGAGRIDASLASRVGLYLPLKSSAFASANPDAGGIPSTLNLPGLVNESCGLSCSFVRTVRAHRSGSWTVSVEGDAGIAVSPSSFSLAKGQDQVLNITVTPTPSLAGALEEDRIVLSEAIPSFQTGVTQPVKQYLTVAVANNKTELPSTVEFTTTASKGKKTLEIPSVRGLSRARYLVSDLSTLTKTTTTLPVDPTNDNPFDGGVGVEVFVVDVPAEAMGLYAQTTESGAQDIDLFVGRDLNGDGLAQESELVCESTSPNAFESCWVKQPSAGSWWVLVQNWDASIEGASDETTLVYGVAETSVDPVLFVAGPGVHPGGPLDLTVYFDDPSLKADDLRLGAVEIVSGLDADSTSIASIPFVFERTFVSQAKNTVLFPNETLPVTLQAQSVHEKLFIDVPSTTTELAVTVKGDAGVTASLRRVDFDQLAEFSPQTPPVPDAQLATGSGSSSGFTMAITDPDPGRYYVVLDNSTGPNRAVEVTANLEEDGRIDARYALYSPVGREINQGVEFQDASQPFAVWYSFDDQGVPIFYLGSAALNPESSVWVAPLDRYTRGLERQVASPAGRMALTSIDRETAIFSWRLNGAHGSDVVSAAIIPETCVTENGQQKSYTGHWYSPGRDQGGSTTIMSPGIQIQVRYYYDTLGVGRWVQLFAPTGGETADTLLVREYRGFCPNCDDSNAPDFDDIGIYSRQYESESVGEEVLVFESGPPLNQSFQTPEALPIEKLSNRLACPE